jgi:hypothetical protein
MSASGTKRTSVLTTLMSAFGGKADITRGRSAKKKWSPSPPLGVADRRDDRSPPPRYFLVLNAPGIFACVAIPCRPTACFAFSDHCRRAQTRKSPMSGVVVSDSAIPQLAVEGGRQGIVVATKGRRVNWPMRTQSTMDQCDLRADSGMAACQRRSNRFANTLSAAFTNSCGSLPSCR